MPFSWQPARLPTSRLFYYYYFCGKKEISRCLNLILHQKKNFITCWNFSQHGNNKFELVVLGSKPLHSHSNLSCICTWLWTRSLGYFNPYRNLPPNMAFNVALVWGDLTVSMALQLFMSLFFFSLLHDEHGLLCSSVELQLAAHPAHQHPHLYQLLGKSTN